MRLDDVTFAFLTGPRAARARSEVGAAMQAEGLGVPVVPGGSSSVVGRYQGRVVAHLAVVWTGSRHLSAFRHVLSDGRAAGKRVPNFEAIWRCRELRGEAVAGTMFALALPRVKGPGIDFAGLTVACDNPAVAVYQANQFEIVEALGTFPGKTGAPSYYMLRDLHDITPVAEVGRTLAVVA